MKNKFNLLKILLPFSLVIILLTITYLYFTQPKENLILTCDQKNIQVGKNFTCTIYGYQKEYEVSSLTTTIKTSDNVEIIQVTPDTSFEGDGENGIIELYTDENKKGKFPIATVVFSLANKNEITIQLKDNAFFDEKFKEHKLTTKSKKLVVK